MLTCEHHFLLSVKSWNHPGPCQNANGVYGRFAGDCAGETTFPVCPPARRVTNVGSAQGVGKVQTRIKVLVLLYRCLLYASVHLQKYLNKQYTMKLLNIYVSSYVRRITALWENDHRKSKYYTHTVSYKLGTLHWEATITTWYLPDRLESRATLAATRVRMRVASSRGRRGSALQPFGQKDCLRNIQSLYNHSRTAYCNVAGTTAVFYSHFNQTWPMWVLVYRYCSEWVLW